MIFRSGKTEVLSRPSTTREFTVTTRIQKLDSHIYDGFSFLLDHEEETLPTTPSITTLSSSLSSPGSSVFQAVPDPSSCSWTHFTSNPYPSLPVIPTLPPQHAWCTLYDSILAFAPAGLNVRRMSSSYGPWALASWMLLLRFPLLARLLLKMSEEHAAHGKLPGGGYSGLSCPPQEAFVNESGACGAY